VELTRQAFVAGATSALLIPQVEIAEARTKPISMLPTSSTRRFAWTVDDGVSGSALKAYLDIAEHKNQHLTLFVTSSYPSWRNNSKQILRLIKAGKVQLGNHTVMHKDLTTTSSAVIRKELQGCHKFLLEEFDYDARPYFRPTYGSWNANLLKIAAELGYTAPITWYGSLGDTGTPTQAHILQQANKWIANGRILLCHANRNKAPETLNQILNIIQTRKLHSVTLKEAFGANFK